MEFVVTFVLLSGGLFFYFRRNAESHSRRENIGEEGVFIENTFFAPPLPDQYSGIIQMKGDSEAGTVYSVSLKNFKCSCKDWVEGRKHFKVNDFRRICKHLARALISNGIGEKYDHIARSILEEGSGTGGVTKGTFKVISLDWGDRLCLEYQRQYDWVNVTARRRKPGDKNPVYTGTYGRYGYNLKEKRWAYGSGPAGAGHIRDIIKKEVGI